MHTADGVHGQETLLSRPSHRRRLATTYDIEEHLSASLSPRQSWPSGWRGKRLAQSRREHNLHFQAGYDSVSLADSLGADPLYSIGKEGVGLRVRNTHLNVIHRIRYYGHHAAFAFLSPGSNNVRLATPSDNIRRQRCTCTLLNSLRHYYYHARIFKACIQSVYIYFYFQGTHVILYSLVSLVREMQLRSNSARLAPGTTTRIQQQNTHPGQMAGRGRSGTKQQTAKIQKPAPSVPYQVYPCGWASCQAQLHNLKTLKVHVIKIHLSSNNNHKARAITEGANGDDDDDDNDEARQFTCLWKECSCVRGLSRGKLREHVLDEHVEPYAWKFGDGPFVPGIGEMFPLACTQPLLTD